MTTEEMLAVVVGVGVGYAIVSWFMSRSLPRVHSVWKGQVVDEPEPVRNNENRTEPGRKEGESDSEYIQKSWYLILGVPQDADRETVVAAYRKKIRQYHPDRVAALGDELRELAEFKSKQINAAYDYAQSLFG